MENKNIDRFCEIYDYDMSTHPIVGAISFREIKEGIIYRGTINSKEKQIDIDRQDLDFLIEANSKRRRSITAKIHFNWAGRKKVPEIGKASSAFLFKYNNKLVIDYFVENQSHIRGSSSVMHNYMRENFNYCKQEVSDLRSGHIVPFNVTTKDCGWLLLLDCFDNANVRQEFSKISSIIDTLYGNRIIPITSNGYLIS
ncbi:hypothetical protein A2422_01630 [Candidatus Woesebacteria bacterium RIFOXYC1_FULL_31_51]|uniref:Uncharacterized protein n=1 Tax=Candidatus Woesebacteria bacterium GW2011_GWC2_31_9 TaxID=1618586 RepID=A0A0G0AZ27_9BACT|nr:MAG: hypothetical protein UR17_C0001G0782 [Candidatus Woesebacteria bacterium GW2011_GWF1_31_35]KKP26949.1 MAG: hypothetical protein UR13_C0001G0044 [Candidatus Woesebacteria bacterium GW2011_GWD1_31_12]KKP27214.1 MAG: hypothetical protein UR16_C0005G0001 [Candidatus Woesebacteria bacterium GW2011_GWB1_31_29]KKP31805.1 MAG: hypothetical protein UR21_C0005G0027 [Candidatus Woesebacteria bacterium GW2011_GWC2_31_9]KKP33901.1 MAG: hypothetical protein UR20_C0006G0004 [Candidatus Woesebacteria b